MKRTFALLCLVTLTVGAAVAIGYGQEDSEEDTSAEYIEVGGNTHEALTFLTISNSTMIGFTGNVTANNAVVAVNTSISDVDATVFKPPLHHRIVGGRQISISEAPWQVAVIRETTFICGGSLISSYWVLTAAHCVVGNVNRRHAARAGSDRFKRGGQLRIAARVTYHGAYSARTAANDIALLRMRRGFTFNSRVRPLRLASFELSPGSYSISGWGTLSENSDQPTVRLRGVSVKPVSRTSCGRAYRGRFDITNNMICAAAPRQDSCQGDSGGPLSSRGTQYGIVSFGEGCARSRYPGVYTSIPRYRNWILMVMRSFGPSSNVRFVERL